MPPVAMPGSLVLKDNTDYLKIIERRVSKTMTNYLIIIMLLPLHLAHGEQLTTT